MSDQTAGSAERSGHADGGSDECAPLVSEAEHPVASHHHKHTFLEAFQSLVYVIIVALFLLTFSVQPFRIPSESMEPTLLVGDFLLVNKQIGIEVPPRIYAPESEIRRGDLVVFHYPVDPGLHLVKRVVGLPGDHLKMRDGRVLVEGRTIDEPYAVFRDAGPDGYRDDFPRMNSVDPSVNSRWWVQMRSLVANGELTVPAEDYFVLGDNRDNSEDSRYWGFVPRANIVGKPFLIYFSLNGTRSTPGQQTAAAMAGGPAGRETPGVGHGVQGLARLVRWERVFRIPR